jgi:hypothetical protein
VTGLDLAAYPGDKDTNKIGLTSTLMRVCIYERIEPCTYSADMAVHPDYRRMDISNKMRFNVSRPWRKQKNTEEN